MAAETQLGADISWTDFAEFTQQLAERIRSDRIPQTIVGILRGGMIPAVALAHQLDVRDVRAVEVTRTLSDGIQAEKSSAPRLRNPASLGNLVGRDVLLVDDVAGSGTTLAHTRRIIAGLTAARLRTAVLCVNQANWLLPQQPQAAIDYIALRCEGWVIFPWETR
ncbi:purine phosphoribosyltransferase [Streptomyces sp. TRM66268-LWL]|uniref:Purine phosphoribosyltransferase n=1 Tax=Streptomyces polyasparticus TaxID=2767826 RepID=A0ABR7SUW3_9ACTN|nr:phosphoribosyltransferase family protein [Streptomyces polyasparticus]MBC9718435.1 purine phosphoribosyltransferase [Streptomyces polyasparticus]